MSVLTTARAFKKYVRQELRWYRQTIPAKALSPLLLANAVPRRTRRLVIFLTPGVKLRSGGVLSIASLYTESLKLQHVHDARVVLCTIPGDPPLLKYDWFDNKNYILDLQAVMRRAIHLESVLLHIPEYAVKRVTAWLESDGRMLTLIRNVHLNILLQNIDMFEEQSCVGLARFGKVTCTTAHEAYTTNEVRDRLRVPLHRLSVFIDPQQYHRSDYASKEPILVVSPDQHPMKRQVLEKVCVAFPHLQIRVVENLSYDAYRQLIGRAKWSLTFGEGMDGYFVEPIFCGSVSFAVFNSRFFTPPFAQLENVYPSWEALLERIVRDLHHLDEPGAYRRCNDQAYSLLATVYQIDRYRENLRRFYVGQYTFP